MGWSALISLGVAVLAALAAYAVIRLSRPVVVHLRAMPLTTMVSRHGLAGWSWLTSRVAAQFLILLAGSAVVVGLAATFTEILDAVVDDDDLTAIDRPVVQWLAGHRTPTLTSIEVAITNLGGAPALAAALAVTAVAVAVRLQSWRPIVLTVVALGGIQLLVFTIKLIIGRERPSPATQVVVADGFSFPSGHSASSLVGFAVVAWLISMSTRRHNVWATAWLASLLLAVAVGLSRIYLGVHYPSDVLGGWTLGLTWLVAVAVAASVWRAPPRVSALPGSGQRHGDAETRVRVAEVD